jgi:hypothetical protein
MDAICEAEIQGESVYKLMFEENKRMNREQTVVSHFSTMDGTSNLSHTSTILSDLLWRRFWFWLRPGQG